MSRPNTNLLAILALGSASSSLALERGGVTCPEDPYADPANDPCNVLKYIPSFGANAAAAGLYFLTAVLLTVHISIVFLWDIGQEEWVEHRARKWFSQEHFRYRARWMMVLTIGAYCEAAGLGVRLAVRNNPQTLGPYVGMNTIVVLSPCLFLAADYILLGRLVAYLDASEHIRPLKARLVSRVFVASDILTFIIQGSGGGLAASSNADLGSKLFLIGLALQLASFGIFTCMWAIFGYRIKKNDPYLWRAKGWKPVYWALGFTCIFYLIRSFFRTIELSQGFNGYLTTHEIWVVLLDTLPLFIGITTFVFVWPGEYIVHGTTFQHNPMRSDGSRSATSVMNLTPMPFDGEEGLEPLRGAGEGVRGATITPYAVGNGYGNGYANGNGNGNRGKDYATQQQHHRLGDSSGHAYPPPGYGNGNGNGQNNRQYDYVWNDR